jgi:hypothetical protein
MEQWIVKHHLIILKARKNPRLIRKGSDRTRWPSGNANAPARRAIPVLMSAKSAREKALFRDAARNESVDLPGRPFDYY